MPMGAKTAPKHFHTEIRKILKKLSFAKDNRNYQDDIFISAQNHKAMVERTEKVKKKLLEQHNFKINKKQSELPARNVLGYEFLKHVQIPEAKRQWLQQTLNKNPKRVIHSLFTIDFY